MNMSKMQRCIFQLMGRMIKMKLNEAIDQHIENTRDIERLECSICGEEILTEDNGWDGGHNAEPINEGRCCSKCNMEVVVPARIKQLQEKPAIQITIVPLEHTGIFGEKALRDGYKYVLDYWTTKANHRKDFRNEEQVSEFIKSLKVKFPDRTFEIDDKFNVLKENSK